MVEGARQLAEDRIQAPDPFSRSGRRKRPRNSSAGYRCSLTCNLAITAELRSRPKALHKLRP